MGRLLRSLWRLAKVAGVLAAVVAGLVWVSKRRAREKPEVSLPVWPSLPADEAADGGAEVAPATDLVGAEEVGTDLVGAEEVGLPDRAEHGTAVDDAEPVVWVLPKDGACPEGYPVKAKAASRIYHLPGGTSYARTVPDRCYATPADAEADGFRPAKR